MADRAAEPVPDMVKQFVVYFYRHIREKNVYEILSMYEKSFAAISERYFKASGWPAVEAVARFADNDHVFCLLYKELYFRHAYSKMTPTLEQRCESWDNYCNLFGVILHGNVNMQLPNLWLWEMIDEFIYQFQSFCQYRGKLSVKTKEELALLKDCDQVWNVVGVLNYLQALVDKSEIHKVLDRERKGEESFTDREGYDYHSSNVLRTLGYFSLIGLHRVHCLLGDYTVALKVLDPIDLDKQGMFTKVAGCNVSTTYHVGFCYFMLRRYTDTIRHFNASLIFISRLKVSHTRPYSLDMMLKKQEQMYALLAIATTVCITQRVPLEEGVINSLREKYGEKMSKLQQGDVHIYDELFSYACPKFVTPAAPDYDDSSANLNQEAYRMQLKMFLTEVASLNMIPTLRSYLKLYTTIPIGKLADLMELEPEKLRQNLTCMKQKTRVLEWRGGASALDGTWVNISDVDFTVNGDMIHVQDFKPPRRDGEYFLHHIAKQNQLMEDLAPAKPLVYKGTVQA